MSVADAADELGVTPWDVMRLIQSGAVQGLVYVDAASLKAAKERQ